MSQTERHVHNLPCHCLRSCAISYFHCLLRQISLLWILPMGSVLLAPCLQSGPASSALMATSLPRRNRRHQQRPFSQRRSLQPLPAAKPSPSPSKSPQRRPSRDPPGSLGALPCPSLPAQERERDPRLVAGARRVLMRPTQVSPRGSRRPRKPSRSLLPLARCRHPRRPRQHEQGRVQAVCPHW